MRARAQGPVLRLGPAPRRSSGARRGLQVAWGRRSRSSQSRWRHWSPRRCPQRARVLTPVDCRAPSGQSRSSPGSPAAHPDRDRSPRTTSFPRARRPRRVAAIHRVTESWLTFWLRDGEWGQSVHVVASLQRISAATIRLKVSASGYQNLQPFAMLIVETLHELPPQAVLVDLVRNNRTYRANLPSEDELTMVRNVPAEIPRYDIVHHPLRSPLGRGERIAVHTWQLPSTPGSFRSMQDGML